MYHFLEKASCWFLGIFDVQYHGDFVQCIKALASSNTFWIFCLLLFLFIFFFMISYRIFSTLTFILLLLVIFNVDVEDAIEQLPKHFSTAISKIQEKGEIVVKNLLKI